MRVWTLAPPTDRPFEGDSTVEKAGRWHRPGMRIAYASESLPLALLELLVHLDGPPGAVHAYALDVPDALTGRVERDALPPTWRDDPAPPELCEVTGRWLSEKRAAALLVPSAVVEDAWNVLIDPAHPSWSRPLRPVIARPFEIDPRLLG